MKPLRLTFGLLVAASAAIAGGGLGAGCGSADTESAADAGDAGPVTAPGGGATGSGGSPGGAGGQGTGPVTSGAGGTAGPAGSGGAAESGRDAGADAPGSAGTSGGGAAGGGASAAGGRTGATGGSTGATGGSAGVVPLDPSLLSLCTGTGPILCTIPVANNGNYTVTVELGSATVASTSRVQAETYRIVVPPLALAAGSYSQQNFSVNVRAEVHDGYAAVGRVLNLRIDGPAPALHGLGYVAAPSIPTVFFAGDSTVCDWDPAYTAVTPATAGVLERGWAQEVSQFFKAGIAMADYADSGETASTFYGKFWPPAKAALRAGDYVFIQFGHNDQKVDTIAAFTTNMMRYVTDARNAGATPVLVTPPGRKTATATDSGFAGFDQATRDLARSANVTLVDLTTLSISYSGTVPDKSVVFANPTEPTHFSEIGATALSKLVTTDLKAGTLPLRDLLR
jgi:lysophospholipase L1-like esterase